MLSQHDRALIIQAHRRKQKRKKIIGFFVCVVIGFLVGFFGFKLLAKPASNVNSNQGSTTELELSDSAASTTTTTQESDDIVITLFGDENTQVLKGEQYIESSCHATDTKNKKNISSITTSGSVDTSKTGTYEIKYTAKADDGRTKSATRKVSVVDSFESGNAQAIPVCMYHYVYDETNKPDEIDGNWIEASLLKQEVQWTKDQKYYYPSYEELKAFVEGKKTLPMKSIIFTFDDAKPEFLDSGNPIFNELKVPATSFVICNDGDAADKVFAHPSAYVQYQSHSYGMHQAGSNVGRGGRIHACSFDEILADQQKAVGIIGNTQAYAYPFGDNNETAQKALAQAGVECAFTIENRQIKQGDSLMALPRVRINGTYTLEQFQSLVS